MIAEKVRYVDDKQLNIDFPHGLGLHEAQNLMRHLKNDAQVHVYVNYTSYYSDESWPVEKEMGDIGITGTLILKKDTSISSKFYLDSQKDKRSEFSRFKFIRTYDKVSDYKPEAIQLWSNVRKSIDDFFRPK